MVFGGGALRAILPARRLCCAAGAIAAAVIFNVTAPAVAVAQEGGVTELEGIVVTGEKIDRPYVDTFTSVGVATNEDIENYHLDDLNDTFNQMANVRSF